MFNNLKRLQVVAARNQLAKQQLVRFSTSENNDAANAAAETKDAAKKSNIVKKDGDKKKNFKTKGAKNEKTKKVFESETEGSSVSLDTPRPKRVPQRAPQAPKLQFDNDKESLFAKPVINKKEIMREVEWPEDLTLTEADQEIYKRKAAFLKTVGFSTMQLRQFENQQDSASFTELQQEAYNKIQDKYDQKLDALLASESNVVEGSPVERKLKYQLETIVREMKSELEVEVQALSHARELDVIGYRSMVNDRKAQAYHDKQEQLDQVWQKDAGPKPIEIKADPKDTQVFHVPGSFDHRIATALEKGTLVSFKDLATHKQNLANQKQVRIAGLAARFETMVESLQKQNLIDPSGTSKPLEPKNEEEFANYDYRRGNEFMAAMEEAIKTQGVESAFFGMKPMIKDHIDFRFTNEVVTLYRDAFKQEMQRIGATPEMAFNKGMPFEMAKATPELMMQVYKEGEISKAAMRKLRIECPQSMVKAIVAYNQNPSQQTSVPMLDELKMLQQVMSKQDKMKEVIAQQKAQEAEVGKKLMLQKKIKMMNEEQPIKEVVEEFKTKFNLTEAEAVNGVICETDFDASDELKFPENQRDTDNSYSENEIALSDEENFILDEIAPNDDKSKRFMGIIDLLSERQGRLSRREIENVVKGLEEADPEVDADFQPGNYPEKTARENRVDTFTDPIMAELRQLSQKLRPVDAFSETDSEFTTGSSMEMSDSEFDIAEVNRLHANAVSQLNDAHVALYQRLNLDKSFDFKVFMAELHTNTEVDGKSPLLNQLFTIMEGLNAPRAPDSLIDTVVQIAKFSNKFGTADKYMRQFARLMMQEPSTQQICRKLEVLMNCEVAIKRQDKPDEMPKAREPVLHPNVIAQAGFNYLPAAQKLQKMNEFRTMKSELQRSRDMKDMLTQADVVKKEEMLKFGKLDELLEQIEGAHDINPNTLATFHRHKKTNYMVNMEIENMIRNQFGVKGINFDNLEQLYNAQLTGYETLHETRDFLLQHGMSDKMADQLMKRYLQKVRDESEIYSLIDLFNKPVAKAHLNQAQYHEIYTNYVNLHGTQTQSLVTGDLYQKSRMKPIKPIGSPFPQAQVRMFGTLFKSVDERQGNFAQSAEDKKFKEKRNKFMDFLEEAERVDTELADEASKESSVQFNFDADNLNVDFASKDPTGGFDAAIPALGDMSKAAGMQAQSEHEKLIIDAKRKYNKKWFNKFAFAGKDAEKLTQQALEEHLMREKDVEEIRMICLSMINSSYQLNDIIPNIEMMFYKIFCSPMTTKEQRKGNDNLLEGNLFLNDKQNLGPAVYRSLLETVSLYPKKKHFKKIVQHILQFEDRENVTPELLDLLVKIGIEQKYPVLLGHTMKYFLQNDYAITRSNFKDFMLFLERSKGFEEDAKRFITMTTDTHNVQINYELLRPMFLRTIYNKKGPEVLKLFEQFRKNLKLNKAWANKPKSERDEKLKEIKCEIYDGLVQDLLKVKAYTLTEVIYSEKLKEKYDMSAEDHMMGLEIYAVQKKMADYQVKFRDILTEKIEGISLDTNTCEELGRTLAYFDSNEFSAARVEMTEDLEREITFKRIPMTGKTFDSLIYVFSESQNWAKVKSLVDYSQPDNCEPNADTAKFLKRNLVYCFDSGLRSSLKDSLDTFELKFFHDASKSRELKYGTNQQPSKRQGKAPKLVFSE